MHGEDLLIDDGGNRQTVEAIGERLPQLDVVPPLALVVEAIDTVDGRALVVTAQDEEVFGVLDLVGKEKANRLERLLATVDVITEEEVVGFWGKTTVFEEAQEIVVLAVDVATDLLRVSHDTSTARLDCDRYLDGRFQLQEDGLRNEDLPSLGAQITNLRLQKLDLLSRPAAPHFQQSVDDRVQIHFLLSHDCRL